LQAKKGEAIALD